MGNLLFLIWPLVLLHLVTGMAELALVIGGAFAIYIVFGVMTAPRADRVFTLAVMALAVAVAAHDRRLGDLMATFASTSVFAAFIPSTQLLRTAAESSPQVLRFRKLLGAQPRAARPTWFAIGTAFLAPATTVGAIALLSPLFDETADPRQRRDEVIAAVTGVALALVWSPFFVAMAVVTSFFPGVPLWAAMGTGFALSLLGLVLFLLARGGPSAFGQAWQALRALGGFVPLVLASGALVVLFRVWGGFSTLQSACLAIPLLCLLLVAAGEGGLPAVPGRSMAVVRETILRTQRLGGDVAVVALAFLLGLVLRDSPSMAEVVGLLGLGGLPGPLILLLVPSAMLLLGIFTIHPIVAGSLMLALTVGHHPGVGDLALLGSALAGWGAASMLSSTSLLVVVTSAVSAVPRRELVRGRNAFFAPAFILIAGLFLALFDRIAS
ncbi:hypothetical protein [Arvimicrobium flavum]|uniref:hypothetical protein n=1 Tax=Arvimicrobium flavum TaxID=3393320 RepID=UPI00237B2536|nr:hypothetical protein [Mesorhizobium shangrilense]